LGSFISRFSHFPLQTLKQFEIQDNPMNAIGFFVILALIVVLAVFLNLSKRVQKSRMMSTGMLTDKSKRGAKNHELMKVIAEYDFSASEKRLVEELFVGVHESPATIFADKRELEGIFRDGYRSIKQDTVDDDELKEKLATFFSVRNTIEYFEMAKEQAKSSYKKRVLRRFKRKSFSQPVPCNFWEVTLVETKEAGKKKSKLVLGAEKFLGQIVDLSVGGCALKTAFSIKAGMRLKLEIANGRTKVLCLGQVIRLNKGAGFIVLHIKFVKVPSMSKNNIYAWVFDYN
jgi:hypothetical protein